MALPRRIANAALLCALSGSLFSVDAQTRIAGTFGPLDSYKPGIGWAVRPNQSIAQSFANAGPGATLASVRVAVFKAPNYLATLWSGVDMNTAAPLENWAFNAPTDGIVTLNSVGTPLAAGGNFFISLSNATANGGWFQNNQGFLGLSGNFPPNTLWYSAPNANSPSSAYDVNATVVPEASSVALLAAGLAMLGVAARRRRSA